METLPNELILVISKTEYKLHLVCKTFYNLLPAPGYHVTYPEYLRCLEAGDSIYLCRSENAYKWYRDEHISPHDIFVKHLSYHKVRVAHSAKSHTKGGLFKYKPHKSIEYLCTKNPDPSSWYHGHKSQYISEARREDAMRMFDNLVEKGVVAPNVIYYGVKRGLWDMDKHGKSKAASSVYTALMLYGHGYITLNNLDKLPKAVYSRAVGVMSEDYPEEMLSLLSKIPYPGKAAALTSAMYIKSRAMDIYHSSGNEMGAVCLKTLYTDNKDVFIKIAKSPHEKDIVTLFGVCMLFGNEDLASEIATGREKYKAKFLSKAIGYGMGAASVKILVKHCSLNAKDIYNEMIKKGNYDLGFWEKIVDAYGEEKFMNEISADKHIHSAYLQHKERLAGM